MKKYYFVITVSLLFTFSKPEAGITKNVVIVVIDGARYSETFGDSSHEYIPKIWKYLRPKGTLFTSVYIDGGLTETIPGHSSIITGTWQKIPNDGSKHPDKPTLFEYYRKQYSCLKTDCYLILGKEKLDIISYSTNREYGKRYASSVRISKEPSKDIETWLNTKEIMHEYQPHVVLINFSATDIAGHSKKWNYYTASLQKADSLVYELWTFLQSNSSYRNNTIFVITTDHGRHSDRFWGHGCKCDGCKHVILFISGPGVPEGKIDQRKYNQIDILPTIGNLINLETPFSEGNKIEFISK